MLSVGVAKFLIIALDSRRYSSMDEEDDLRKQ